LAVFQELEVRKQVLMETLAESAGSNPLEDRYHVGYIAAINDLLRISLDEIKEP
jgi:hypothetical protein